jgi:hypothetical protein
MNTSIEAKELTIVFIGQFNPAIINPSWLLLKSLISEPAQKQALENNNYISHPEISQFKLDYCTIQITKDRYLIESTQEGYFESLREHTLGIFSSLKETPIYQMGINLAHHYRFKDKDEYNKFGDLIAPKKIWNEKIINPGLKKIEIRSERNDKYKGEINTYLGISSNFEMGLRIQVNDHYTLYNRSEVSNTLEINAAPAITMLKDNWENSMKNSTSIIENLISHAN